LRREASGRPYGGLSVFKSTYEKAGEGLFMRVHSDRTRRHSFKLNKGGFILRYKKEILHYGGGEALEQVAQRSCGCPLPGSVQGQIR